MTHIIPYPLPPPPTTRSAIRPLTRGCPCCQTFCKAAYQVLGDFQDLGCTNSIDLGHLVSRQHCLHQFFVWLLLFAHVMAECARDVFLRAGATPECGEFL